MPSRSRVNNIVLTALGALLSIPLVVNVEELLHYATPGMYIQARLFRNGHDLSNLGAGIAISVGLDSILCFGLMRGAYAAYSKVRQRKT